VSWQIGGASAQMRECVDLADASFAERLLALVARQMPDIVARV